MGARIASICMVGFVAIQGCELTSQTATRRTSGTGKHQSGLQLDGTPIFDAPSVVQVCKVSSMPLPQVEPVIALPSTDIVYSDTQIPATAYPSDVNADAEAVTDIAPPADRVDSVIMTPMQPILSLDFSKPAGNYNCKKSDWLAHIGGHPKFKDFTKNTCKDCDGPADDNSWPCPDDSKKLFQTALDTVKTEMTANGGQCPAGSDKIKSAIAALFKYNNVGWTMAASEGCFTACGLEKMVGNWLDYNKILAAQVAASMEPAVVKCLVSYFVSATEDLQKEAKQSCEDSKKK